MLRLPAFIQVDFLKSANPVTKTHIAIHAYESFLLKNHI